MVGVAGPHDKLVINDVRFLGSASFCDDGRVFLVLFAFLGFAASGLLLLNTKTTLIGEVLGLICTISILNGIMTNR